MGIWSRGPWSGLPCNHDTPRKTFGILMAMAGQGGTSEALNKIDCLLKGYVIYEDSMCPQPILD